MVNRINLVWDPVSASWSLEHLTVVLPENLINAIFARNELKTLETCQKTLKMD